MTFRRICRFLSVLIMICQAALVLFCFGFAAYTLLAPSEPQEPSAPAVQPTPAPVAIQRTLPAPDVYLGLEADAARQGIANPIYMINLARYPEKAIASYAQLLVEKYGMQMHETVAGTVLKDENGTDCVEIMWMEWRSGVLMVSFMDGTAAAALETLEHPMDVLKQTEDNYRMLCSHCDGTDQCPDCGGTGKTTKMLIFSSTCSACDGDGKCPHPDCVQGRRFTSTPKEYTNEEIRSIVRASANDPEKRDELMDIPADRIMEAMTEGL